MSISRRTILAGVGAAALQAQPPKKLKLAFIGTGHRAWAHIQVLKSIPDFEVVALADPTPEFRDQAATLVEAGVRTYASYQEMLAKEKDLDGVIVVTPSFLHAPATRRRAFARPSRPLREADGDLRGGGEPDDRGFREGGQNAPDRIANAVRPCL